MWFDHWNEVKFYPNDIWSSGKSVLGQIRTDMIDFGRSCGTMPRFLYNLRGATWLKSHCEQEDLHASKCVYSKQASNNNFFWKFVLSFGKYQDSCLMIKSHIAWNKCIEENISVSYKVWYRVKKLS